MAIEIVDLPMKNGTISIHQQHSQVTWTMASLQAQSDGHGHEEGRGQRDAQALQRT
jgi:hypothetical protein